MYSFNMSSSQLNSLVEKIAQTLRKTNAKGKSRSKLMYDMCWKALFDLQEDGSFFRVKQLQSRVGRLLNERKNNKKISEERAAWRELSEEKQRAEFLEMQRNANYDIVPPFDGYVSIT